MRTNVSASSTGGYNYAGAKNFDGENEEILSCVGIAANCSADQLADFDLGQWETLLDTYLTNGTGSIVTVDNGTTIDVTITISWADAYSVDDGNEIVTFTTELPR